jgi:VanZ family protein
LAEQSWWRPTPQTDQLTGRAPGRPLVPRFLRSWWPAVLWGSLIFFLSTDTFSAQHTGSVLYPVLHWLFPSLTLQLFEPIHHLIRKSAHFTEYFIFYVLLFRGARGERQGWRWTWALAALSIAAGYSALDEIHQAFVASRTASPWDSLLDSVGAFAASLVLYAWHRRPGAGQAAASGGDVMPR